MCVCVFFARTEHAFVVLTKYTVSVCMQCAHPGPDMSLSALQSWCHLKNLDQKMGVLDKGLFERVQYQGILDILGDCRGFKFQPF